MGPLLKLLVVALLTLPAGAFAMGRLAAGPVDPVPHREPVVLEDPLPVEPARTITGGPGRDGRPKPGRGPGQVEVIGPRPTELDDGSEDREDAAAEREPTGGGRDPSPQDDPRDDDGDERELDDREDDGPADPDEPEDDDPEDAETDEPQDEESDDEPDEEDDEADDD